MGSFTFNGVTSTTHGLRVTSDYIISSTGSDVETVAVPGRDGDLLISKNRLKSVTIELPCTVLSNRKLTDAESDISNWLKILLYHGTQILSTGQLLLRLLKCLALCASSAKSS